MFTKFVYTATINLYPLLIMLIISLYVSQQIKRVVLMWFFKKKYLIKGK